MDGLTIRDMQVAPLVEGGEDAVRVQEARLLLERLRAQLETARGVKEALVGRYGSSAAE